MTHPASEADVAAAQAFLKSAGFNQLRCRRRADTLIIESGPADDPLPCVRLRKVGARVWSTDSANHAGRWERMHLMGSIVENLQAIVENFPWMLGDEP